MTRRSWRQPAHTARTHACIAPRRAAIHHGHHGVMPCAQALNLAGKLGLFTTLYEQGQWPGGSLMVVVGRQTRLWQRLYVACQQSWAPSMCNATCCSADTLATSRVPCHALLCMYRTYRRLRRDVQTAAAGARG